MAEEQEQHYGYHYGEEEKGLFDPAWERQQKKVCLLMLQKIFCYPFFLKKITLNEFQFDFEVYDIFQNFLLDIQCFQTCFTILMWLVNL